VNVPVLLAAQLDYGGGGGGGGGGGFGGECAHRPGRAVREEHVVNVRNEPVAPLQELAHLPPHQRRPAAVRVRPQALQVSEVLPGAGLGVRGERRGHLGVVQEEGGCHEGDDLAHEGERHLPQRVGVAHAREDDGLPRRLPLLRRQVHLTSHLKVHTQHVKKVRGSKCGSWGVTSKKRKE